MKILNRIYDVVHVVDDRQFLDFRPSILSLMRDTDDGKPQRSIIRKQRAGVGNLTGTYFIHCPFPFTFRSLVLSVILLSHLIFSLAFSLIFPVSMSRWRSMTDEAVTADKQLSNGLTNAAETRCTGWLENKLERHFIPHPGLGPCGKFSIELPIAYTRICLTMDR